MRTISKDQDKNSDDRGRKRKAAAPADTPENSIRLFKSREKDRAPAPGPDAGAKATGRAKPSAQTPAPSRAMPDDVEARFVKLGQKFYFPNGEPAFVDKGEKLTTQSENAEIVRTLVSIAQTRGWQKIAIGIRSTESFRKQVWFAAQAVGIAVRGYKPSKVEQVQLVRSLAKQRQAEQKPTAQPRTDSPRSNPARTEEERQVRRDAVFRGRLKHHGAEDYKGDPLESESYRVVLDTDKGPKDIWGVDLERAIKQSLSGAKVGDEVIVRPVSRKMVTVEALERNDRGQVIGTAPKATHRNGWIVETREFIEARGRLGKVFRDENITPKDAVKRHPELQGSYLKLQAVDLKAEQEGKDPEQRAQYVQRARVLIAESIERGEALEPVDLNVIPHKREPKREQALQR